MSIPPSPRLKERMTDGACSFFGITRLRNLLIDARHKMHRPVSAARIRAAMGFCRQFKWESAAAFGQMKSRGNYRDGGVAERRLRAPNSVIAVREAIA